MQLRSLELSCSSATADACLRILVIHSGSQVHDSGDVSFEAGSTILHYAFIPPM
jgi:hypothetical protein